MRKFFTGIFLFCCLVAQFGALAQGSAQPPVISIVKKGAEKNSVSLTGIQVNGPNGNLFVQTLKRDLELSGWFRVAANGAVTVRGSVADSGAGMQSNCRIEWPGKAFNWGRVSMGANEVRRQAHQLADEMVRLIAGETGIAQTRIVFVNRRGSNNADLFVCDADGQGVMQITHDKKAVVGPRWAPNGHEIYYTGFLRGYPQIYRMAIGKERKALLGLSSLNTGATLSPDGTRAALISSHQGNPELYVLTLANGRLVRLTQTPYGAEASPCWSPDGRSILYVSDIARAPHLYLVDVATKRSRRITYRGSESVNPDWHPKGGIVYANKRGGTYQIVTLNPQTGENAATVVSPFGNFEHPSWAADGRHIVCASNGGLYILDTLGDPAVRLLNIPGNWMSPDWSRR